MIPFSGALCASVVALSFHALSTSAMDKEYLTPKEIENIQDAQEFDKRIKIYLDAADLRLKTAEERLNGKESPPEDPMEFFSVEDMIDGYYKIIRSVMLNLDEAYQKPETEREKLTKTLKNLKSTTERAQKSLAILKKLAEDKRLEDVWNAVNRATDITIGAHEGAEQGLAGTPEPEKKGPPRKKSSKPSLGTKPTDTPPPQPDLVQFRSAPPEWSLEACQISLKQSDSGNTGGARLTNGFDCVRTDPTQSQHGQRDLPAC
jgi:hypothetical protein